MSDNQDLNQALIAYKNNYAAYKVSGNEAYKVAYQNALTSINTALISSSKIVEGNDKYIQDFLSSYESSNKDIVNLHAKSQLIQKEGPVLQDELVRSKQLHKQEASTINDKILYIKAGVVVGLLIIVGIAGAL